MLPSLEKFYNEQNGPNNEEADVVHELGSKTPTASTDLKLGM